MATAGRAHLRRSCLSSSADTRGHHYTLVVIALFEGWAFIISGQLSRRGRGARDPTTTAAAAAAIVGGPPGANSERWTRVHCRNKHPSLPKRGDERIRCMDLRAARLAAALKRECGVGLLISDVANWRALLVMSSSRTQERKKVIAASLRAAAAAVGVGDERVAPTLRRRLEAVQCSRIG